MEITVKCPLCGGDAEDGVCTECGYELPSAELERNTRIMNAEPDDYPDAVPKKIPTVRIFRRELPQKLERKDELFFNADEEIINEKNENKLPQAVKAGLAFIAGLLVGLVNPLFPISLVGGLVLNAMAKATQVTGADDTWSALGKGLFIGSTIMLFKIVLGCMPGLGLV